MTKGETTGWTQSTLLLLRKILHRILSPFFASANTPVAIETPVDVPIVPEAVASPVEENLAPPNRENSVLKASAVAEPRSLEELFGLEVDASSSTSNPSASTLEELFGLETKVPNWTSTSTAQPSESLSFNDLFEVDSSGPVFSTPPESIVPVSEVIDDSIPSMATPIMSDPWDDDSISQEIAPPSDIEPQTFSSIASETPPMMDLSLDDNTMMPEPQPEPLELENTLIHRASHGDLAAFCQLLNDELSPHGVEVFDVESRNNLLQLSLGAEEVPVQTIVEPIIRAWVLDVGFVKVQKIELYGHRNGSELPHWRSEFNPLDLEYKIQPQDIGFDAQEIPLEVAQYLSDLESGETVHEEVFTTTTLNELWETTPEQEPENSLNVLDRPSPIAETTEFIDTHVSNSTEMQGADTFISDEMAETTVTPSSDSKNVPLTHKQQLVKEFLAQYANGERSFIKIDLSEMDLSGINLTLADLQEAQLVWANLQDASLYHVNLSGAKLRHANLNGAKLRSANLQGADFLNADLSQCDLTWSNLRGANLTGANLANADLKNAILENVIMPDGTLLD